MSPLTCHPYFVVKYDCNNNSHYDSNMKKYNKEDMKANFEHLFKNNVSGTSKIKEITKSIEDMGDDEFLFVSSEDWHIKTEPRRALRNAMPGFRMSIRTLEDGSGWIINKV